VLKILRYTAGAFRGLIAEPKTKRAEPAAIRHCGDTQVESQFVNRQMDGNSKPDLPLDLKALLAPMSPEQFLASYCSKSFCHIPGSPEKFAGLLPWQDLNRVLELHTLRPNQLELIKSGASIDPRSYTEYGTREGWVVPRVNVKEFTNQLREGATLVLSHIHEMHPPLTMLAESLERFFRATSGINVYVAWRDVHGFNIHRDKHDVFIAQVSGKKRWRLYAPIPGKPGKPPTEHTWESIINAGDLLYIPRGLWHAAAPLNEPSLHLSISIENPTIADLVSWVANELRWHDVGQVNISLFATPAERAAALEQTKEAVLGILDAQLVDKYFESSDLRREAQPRFSLPWSATPETLPPDGKTLLKLRSRRKLNLRLDPSNRVIEFTAQGQTWRFPVLMKVLLEAIKNGDAISFDELIALGRTSPGEAMSRAFIATLVKEGILGEVGVDHQS
jgi:ribosomal protein L16 Arg81 hydroxylase